MKLPHALPALLLSLSALSVHAQTQAPGPWEHRFTVKSQGGEMEKAQAAKPAAPRLTGDCTQRDVQRRGGTMTYRVEGRPQQMAMKMSGTWPGAECGDVKPVAALPVK